MAPAIVATLYRKDRLYHPGHGYGRRSQGQWLANRPGAVTSVVIHSTNGNRGSAFSAECAYLRDSSNVSCHDVISKQGTIGVILPPEAEAWHAGACLAWADNSRSYGIEIHHAIGEAYTIPQMESLTWRVKQVIAEHGIIKERIDTHRAVALPRGRKIDPSDWDDFDFYAWRERLYAAPEMVYLTTTQDANVRQGPGRAFPVVEIMTAGTVAGYDPVPTVGESIGGNPNWAHRADQLGFVHTSILVPA
jgi:N-acetyl-anhydromuramyl-L-alanine amidase AmpD